MPDIVIVGGGPVGLWTALQLRHRDPHARIVVHERHEVYQRSHVLRLDHWSLILYGRTVRTPSEEAFYKDVTGKRLSQVQRRFTHSLYIRTNDLEAALKAFALREGIELKHQRIEGLGHAQALYPNCRLFIAADGAHSALRRELLGPDDVETVDLQHVLELKYEETGSSRRLDLAETWQYNRKLHHSAMDFTGKTVQARTPVTLRLFLDSQEFELLPAMSFRQPLALGEGTLPASVQQDLATFLRMRKELTGARAVEGSTRLTKLKLSMYSARHFAQERDGRFWFLVGDAALGVPYFRALNSGLILASRLAQILGTVSHRTDAQLRRRLAWYEVHRPLHVATEFGIARGKDWLLEAYGAVRDWVSSPPEAGPHATQGVDPQEKERTTHEA